MPKKQGEKSKMPDALTEARLCIATAAGPREFSDTRQSWLSRAAKVLGLTPGRITSIWYAKGVRLSADEYLLMKERTEELKWRQRRHEERQHAVAHTISTLVSGNIPPLEHCPSGDERAGSTATAGTRVAASDEA